MKLNVSPKIKIILLVVSVMATSLNAYADIHSEEEQILDDHFSAYETFDKESSLEGFSLDEFLRYGAIANPELRASFFNWKAAVHRIKQAESLSDPEITFKQFIDEVETRVGPQEQIFSISQKLPFPGKLHIQGQVATAESRQKYADFQKQKFETFYLLKNAFFEYWFLFKQIRVTEKNMEFLEHFESVAQSKFKAGKTKNQDLLKAQVELGRLENDILTLNDYRYPLIANLNALMNREISAEIKWPEEIDHRTIELDEQKIYELFYENNPDLIEANERIEASNKKVWLARLDYFPDTTVGFDYIRVSEGPMNSNQNGQDATALMFKMNLPLWFGKQKSQVDEAKAVSESSQAMKDSVQKELEAKVKMIIFRINDAERQIKLYRDALLPKAEQSLNSSDKAYSSGSIDFLNLIDSERTLLEFQLGYYKAIRDYEQRLAQLVMMLGIDLRGSNDEK